MLTVSLIEDDRTFRELMSVAIAKTGAFRVVSEHSDGEEALRFLPGKRPDVAVVDIKLPGMNGIECVRRFRDMIPPLPTQFIILTGYEDDQLISDAFKAGAHGYLLKDHTTCEDLCGAVQDVLTGGGPMTPRIARKVIGFFEQRVRPAALLSEREQQVLQHLADGLAYKEIAGELAISVNTVRKHVGSIYQKLHVHSRAAATNQFAKQPASR